MGSEKRFACIWCQQPTDSLFLRYSSDVIRLQTCSKCGNDVDEYVEYDNLSIFLDILLQKQQAYRHVLYNSGYKLLWRFFFVTVMADAYVNWISWRAESLEMSQALSVDLLEWEFQKRLLISAAFQLVFVICISCFGYYRQKKGVRRASLSSICNGMIVSLFPVILRLPAVIWSANSGGTLIWGCQFLQLISAVQVYSILTSVSRVESFLTNGTLLLGCFVGNKVFSSTAG